MAIHFIMISIYNIRIPNSSSLKDVLKLEVDWQVPIITDSNANNWLAIVIIFNWIIIIFVSNIIIFIDFITKSVMIVN